MLPLIADRGCGRCGKLWPGMTSAAASPGSGSSQLCPACQANPPGYDAALAAALHRDAARELVHLLKYRGVLPVASFWAEHLAGLAALLPAPADVVVPVPLSPRRERQRGYNQSAEISQRLARRLQRRHAPAGLRRRRETLPQSGLDAAARARNLAGAFTANPSMVSGRRVLLVDDVLTTGATADAAATALKHAGALAVDVLTATRADLNFAHPLAIGGVA